MLCALQWTLTISIVPRVHLNFQCGFYFVVRVNIFWLAHSPENRFNQKNDWKIVKTAIRQNALVFPKIFPNSKKNVVLISSNGIKWTCNKNPIKILHLTIGIHLIPTLTALQIDTPKLNCVYWIYWRFNVIITIAIHRTTAML